MDKRSRRILRKNSVLGGFLLVAMVVLTVLTFRLAGITLKKRANWTVYFGAESVIKKGYEVLAAGTKVGVVQSVGLVPDDEVEPGRYVKAVLSLDDRLTLWPGAEVLLRARGILGGFVVVIDRGEPGPRPLPRGTELQGRIEPDLFSEAAKLVRGNEKTIGKIIGDLDAIVGNVRQGRGVAGKILMDEELAAKVENFVSALDQLAQDYGAPDGSLRRIVTGAQIANDLEALTANLRAVSDHVREGKGVAGVLLMDAEVEDRVRKSIDALATLCAASCAIRRSPTRSRASWRTCAR
jgi:ABC-type transporter Mla subunit MlaD